MKNKKGNVAVIALIIVIVAITAGVIGYLFAKRAQAPTEKVATTQPSVQTQQQAPTPTVQQPTQPIDEIANWQTYTDSEIGFELKFPNDWQFQNFKNEKNSAWKFALGNPINGAKNYIFGARIVNNPQKISVIKFVDNFLSDRKVSGKELKHDTYGGTDIIKNISTMELGGIVTNNGKEDWIYVPNGKDKIIIFEFPSAQEIYNFNDPVENNRIARLIVSTFKFKTIGEALSWQTFNNKDYGYEIKLPTNWQIDTHDSAPFVDITDTNSDGNNDDYWVTIEVIPGLDKDLSSWVEDELQFADGGSKGISFLGNEGMELTMLPTIQSPGNIVKYIIRDNTGYKFKTLYGKGKSDGFGDKILSTLKFTY